MLKNILNKLKLIGKQKAVIVKSCDNCANRSSFVDNGVTVTSKEVTNTRLSERRLCKVYSPLDAYECQRNKYKHWKGVS